MPGYSEKAQPYLDAIANGFFSSPAVRDWLLKGTPAEALYTGADVLSSEQRSVRGRTRQPFWANYWCGRDSRCSCRIEGSRALESDAVFFLRNAANRTLAIHIEFKHPNEPFRFGQPEAYPMRAACFVKTHQERPNVNAHDDWMTAIFCDDQTLADERIANFQRIITHTEAARIIQAYPSLANLRDRFGGTKRA